MKRNPACRIPFLKKKILFLCYEENFISEKHADTDNFLSALRRLSPIASVNSAARSAASDTLTQSGYARSDDENCPTVLRCFSLMKILIYTMAIFSIQSVQVTLHF